MSSQSILSFLMSRAAYRLHFHTGSSYLQDLEIKFSPFCLVTSHRCVSNVAGAHFVFSGKKRGKEKSIFVNHKNASVLFEMESFYFFNFGEWKHLGEVKGNKHHGEALEANFQLTCNWSLELWFSGSQRSIIASGGKIF